MIVFQNRIRRAYLKKRSIREMSLFTLFIFAVLVFFGLASREDYDDAKRMADSFTPARRVCIVNWADVAPVFDKGN